MIRKLFWPVLGAALTLLGFFAFFAKTNHRQTNRALTLAHLDTDDSSDPSNRQASEDLHQPKQGPSSGKWPLGAAALFPWKNLNNSFDTVSDASTEPSAYDEEDGRSPNRNRTTSIEMTKHGKKNSASMGVGVKEMLPSFRQKKPDIESEMRILSEYHQRRANHDRSEVFSEAPYKEMVDANSAIAGKQHNSQNGISSEPSQEKIVGTNAAAPERRLSDRNAMSSEANYEEMSDTHSTPARNVALGLGVGGGFLAAVGAATRSGMMQKEPMDYYSVFPDDEEINDKKMTDFNKKHSQTDGEINGNDTSTMKAPSRTSTEHPRNWNRDRITVNKLIQGETLEPDEGIKRNHVIVGAAAATAAGAGVALCMHDSKRDPQDSSDSSEYSLQSYSVKDVNVQKNQSSTAKCPVQTPARLLTDNRTRYLMMDNGGHYDAKQKATMSPVDEELEEDDLRILDSLCCRLRKKKEQARLDKVAAQKSTAQPVMKSTVSSAVTTGNGSATLHLSNHVSREETSSAARVINGTKGKRQKQKHKKTKNRYRTISGISYDDLKEISTATTTSSGYILSDLQRLDDETSSDGKHLRNTNTSKAISQENLLDLGLITVATTGSAAHPASTNIAATSLRQGRTTSRESSEEMKSNVAVRADGEDFDSRTQQVGSDNYRAVSQPLRAKLLRGEQNHQFDQSMTTVARLGIDEESNNLSRRCRTPALTKRNGNKLYLAVQDFNAPVRQARSLSPNGRCGRRSSRNRHTATEHLEQVNRPRSLSRGRAGRQTTIKTPQYWAYPTDHYEAFVDDYYTTFPKSNKQIT